MTIVDLQRARTQKPSWSGVVWLCTGFAVLDFILIPVLSVSDQVDTAVLLFGFLGGCQLGQAGLITLIGSWSGKRWIQGFALGTVLSLTALLITSLGLFAQTEVGFTEFAWGMFLVPCVLAVSAIPFWVVRMCSLGRLTLDPDGHERHASTIQDYFILTAFIGVLFYLFSISIDAWELARWQVWGIALGWSIGFVIIGVISFLPMGMIAFKSTDWTAGFGYQCIYSFGLFILFLFVASAIGGVAPPGEAFVMLMFFFTGATLSFAGGCAALRSAGLEWRNSLSTAKRKAKLAPQVGNPWDESSASEREDAGAPEGTVESHDPAVSPEPASEGEEVASWFGETSFAVAFLLLFTFCGGVASFVLDRTRLAEVASYNGVGRRMLNSGGEAFADWGNEITALRFGPGTTNDDLVEFRTSQFLEELDLSDTQVDDGVLAILEKLPTLKRLSVANTKMTPQVIAALVGRLQPESVDISGISMHEEHLLKILSASERLKHIDISDCRLSFEDLVVVWNSLPDAVSVRGFGLSDKQLLELCKRDFKQMLDLRNNELTGDFLLRKGLAWFVRLEGNPITDTAIKAAAQVQVELPYVSLGNNRLTDACLPDLMQMQVQDLTISDSSFSESALARNIQIGGVRLRRLAIHDPNFRGEITGWANRSLEHLDLSHSGVTPASFMGRGALDVRFLDLSHTKIDNRIFDFLGRGASQHVNLSHTSISSSGLDMSMSLHGFRRPYQIALGQFTDREVLHLRRSQTIRFSPQTEDQMPWFRY